MSRVKQIQEDIAEKRKSILAINDKCEQESRARTDAEKEEQRKLTAELEDLKQELQDAKDVEELRKAQAEADKEARKIANAVDSTFKSEADKEELRKIDAKLSAKSIVDAIANGSKLEGLEAEMDQEARNEFRQFNGSPRDNSINIPSSMIQAVYEQRATVSQGSSDIKPTVVGAYVDALREEAIYEMAGVDVMNGLTADYKIPAVGKHSVAWAAENGAASDIGQQFTKDTLTPYRLSGYVPLSNRILLQNGEAAYQSIFRDLGRATANKIDAALWSTTNVTSAPPSIPATSNVGTFTEVPTYAANSSVLDDFKTAEQTLAVAEGLSGRLVYVASVELLKELKSSAQVASVVAGFGKGEIPSGSMWNINGYPVIFTTAATRDAGTSGDFLFGNMSQIKLGFFGGLSITRDPYSGLKTDTIHIVLHRYVDWATVRPTAFVKGTSLVA